MEIKELKVLICDDSMLVRNKITEIFQSFGCASILEASNGQEAVNLYKENEPNLVFMDIVMPVKTGLEALIEILEYNSEAKIVIASSVGTQSHLKTAIDAGAFDFLQKPIEKQQVKKILDKVCKGDE